MNARVFRILNRAEAETSQSLLRNMPFSDGKVTAKGLARDVKNNLQYAREARELTELDSLLLRALSRHEEFQASALPRSLTLFTYNRYDVGMEYGPHVDNSLMGDPEFGPRTRTDLSFTLFLSPPDSYDGGELCIESTLGPQEIKLDAGEVVVYPSGSLHWVTPVRRGVRLAAVGWIQSIVPDDRLRAILFDLSTSIGRADLAGDKELGLLLRKSYGNLLRYAAQP